MICEALLTDNYLQRDAFQKREKANEDYAIKQREKEKLLELKKKLADQQQHLKKLEDSM
jgi:ATPase inhibitor, mitochondrial